jgi:hypothetical protein
MYEHKENYLKNICRDFKKILRVFSGEKIFGEISVEYLGSISNKKLRGLLGKYL